MEPSDALQTFRRSFYECLQRRKDALFELADAILSADAAAPSPVHLSLPTRAPARMGQLLRGFGPWMYQRGAPARPARPPSALRELSDFCLRRGHERLAPMRRGVQSRTRVLLPSVAPLGGAAHRCRMGLPVRRTIELRARELDGAHGRRARPTRPRRQRGRRRAGEDVPTTPPVPPRKDRRKSPVRLRCGLRSREAPARAGGTSLPDPRPFAGGAALLRRPEAL
jgi:hypothetical protein